MINFYAIRNYCSDRDYCTNCIYSEICDKLTDNLKLPFPSLWTNDLIELLTNSVYAAEGISPSIFNKFIEKRFNEVK